MIEFTHVSKSYVPNQPILEDVSFKVGAGEFVFVAGPSGAGKSTLLKLVAGLESASRGRIEVNGKRLDQIAQRAKPYLRRAVGVILQDTHLLYDRTAIENVMLPLAVVGQPRAISLSRARAALQKVGLADKERSNPLALSGGEQQRLAIARAIVNRPALLIADEPTANLDKDTARRVMTVFKDFNQVGVTTMVATHDEELMAEFAHRVLIIERGRFQDFPVRRDS